ncbi:MAG: molybdopterin-dependent oxidoreductase, partial [Desulfobacteraceae bacterium]|nr:molybdopterin-dependent oxidoreductase [Desulfobacteraceae bacterium]
MKIDRRSFLAMGIGLAAGTALSPLPWKLTDDVSIWTQNWPWTPVPENGDVSIENSVCTLCPGGCGISVRKINDRIVKIEGTPAHPVNNGGICALGISGPQFLYGPSRIKSPMKRSGNRGDGKWTPISWDDAMGEVVNHLNELAKAGKQEGIACISDTDRGTVPQLFKRLLSLMGSPNFMTSPSMSESNDVIFRKMHGTTAGFDMGYDVENADFIISFGSGIIEGWGSPVRMIKARTGWKAKKARLIQAEQRLSNTASAANGLVALKPGTEADFALGMAAVIIDEGLYNKSFVSGSSKGFDEFSALLKQSYTPQAVAEKTGVQPQLIVTLARQFASSTSMAVCGRGKGQTTGSMREFMAVHALNALAGRVNSKGGVIAVETPDYIPWVN